MKNYYLKMAEVEKELKVCRRTIITLAGRLRLRLTKTHTWLFTESQVEKLRYALQVYSRSKNFRAQVGRLTLPVLKRKTTAALRQLGHEPRSFAKSKQGQGVFYNKCQICKLTAWVSDEEKSAWGPALDNPCPGKFDSELRKL